MNYNLVLAYKVIAFRYLGRGDVALAERYLEACQKACALQPDAYWARALLSRLQSDVQLRDRLQKRRKSRDTNREGRRQRITGECGALTTFRCAPGGEQGAYCVQTLSRRDQLGGATPGPGCRDPFLAYGDRRRTAVRRRFANGDPLGARSSASCEGGGGNSARDGLCSHGVSRRKPSYHYAKSRGAIPDKISKK